MSRSNFRIWSTAASVIVAGLFGSAVFAAQPTQPSNDSSSPPQATGGSSIIQSPNNSSSDYPAPEVQAVPAVRAAAVRARLDQDQAQTNLHRWINNSWEDFLDSKDYHDGSDSEKKAADDYNRERDRVIKRLQGDANYRALSDLISGLNERIERERPREMSKVNLDSIEAVMALATVKLGYASTQGAMEAAALSADSDVQNTRTKLMDSSAKMRDLRQSFQHHIRRDPEFVASQARFEEARNNKVVAAVLLDSVVNARTIALDYAYYVHGWDQYRYSTGYYPFSGYGYGGYGNGGFGAGTTGYGSVYNRKY